MKAKAAIGMVVALASGCSLGTGSGEPSTAGECEQFMGLPLIFVEEFDAPAPDQWLPTDPAAWRFTKDGDRTVYGMVAKSSYKPKHRSPEGISIRKDVYVSDFVVDIWWRSMTEIYNHRDMCVFFGHQDPTHFYYVHFGLKSDDASNTIHVVNDAPRTPIVKTRTDGTPWTEDYHHVRVVRKVDSGTIEAYFDDMSTPAMTAQDTALKWGRIGVGSFDDMGWIDRIALWGKTVEPPSEPRGSARAAHR